jgi:hypothetical protein
MKMNFWTRASITTRGTAKQFLGALGDLFDEGFPRRWGEYQPFTIEASAAQYADVIELWAMAGKQELMGLMGYSRTSGLHVDFMLSPTKRPHEVYYFFAQKLIQTSTKVQRSLQLFSRWVSILRPDFARFSAENEWVAKNVRREYVESDGSINPWKVFANDITKGLPGVYWCTYFGPVFAEWIGTKKFTRAPWPFVEQIGDGYLLRRSDGPENWQKEAERDRALIAHLGRGRFFDINSPKRKLNRLKLDIPE